MPVSRETDLIASMKLYNIQSTTVAQVTNTNMFDTSDTARQLIDQALIENTELNRDGSEERMIVCRYTRLIIIRTIFDGVNSFNTASVIFKIGFQQSNIIEGREETLILGIANAICRNQIQDFHFIAHGEKFHQKQKHGKYQASWSFGHYKFRVYTRVSRHHQRTLNYFMQITDTDQLQNDTGDSGDDTDNEVQDYRRIELPPDNKGRMDAVFTVLDSLHKTLGRLESGLV